MSLKDSPSWITALLLWRGLHYLIEAISHALQGYPRWTGHIREFWQNMIHWMREWQIIPLYLPGVPHELHKGPKKKNDTKRWIPPGLKVSNMVLGKSREELSIAPEWMKQLGQSGYNTQLLMCLVMEVKPDAAKNSTVWEPGMLCPWIKENWICQAGDAKNKHRHPRNQWTKMNGNGQI